MKDIHTLKTGLVVLATLLLCACSSRTSTPAPVSPKPEEAKSNPEKEYSFTIQGGKKINASIFDAAQKYGEGKKLIIFLPFVGKTDGNFYLAAREALWNTYGKNRGLFQLREAQTEYISNMEGSAIFWYISNPRQRFYTLPIKDSETGGIGAMIVWVSDLTVTDKMFVRQRSTAPSVQSTEEANRKESIDGKTPDKAASTEDTNVVTTSKGTPKMTELEDSKNKKYRYW
jgi:hypothetical protein